MKDKQHGRTDVEGLFKTKKVLQHPNTVLIYSPVQAFSYPLNFITFCHDAKKNLKT